jgi:hypothetical protein
LRRPNKAVGGFDSHALPPIVTATAERGPHEHSRIVPGIVPVFADVTGREQSRGLE